MILTLRFIVLFILCWLCFLAVPRRWRSLTLALWGAVFYAMFAGAFIAIVLGLSVLVCLGGRRRALAWMTGALIVALLYHFKVRAAVSDFGADAPASATVLIPLGFSYLSFELLHVVIDRRRGRIPELSFPDLLAFVFFAPARVAGPIKRYQDFTAAVRDATLSMANTYAGTLRVLVGMAKKLFIADVLALTVAERPDVRSMAMPGSSCSRSRSRSTSISARTRMSPSDFHGCWASPFRRTSGDRISRRTFASSGTAGTSRCRPGCAITSSCRRVASCFARVCVRRPP